MLKKFIPLICVSATFAVSLAALTVGSVAVHKERQGSELTTFEINQKLHDGLLAHHNRVDSLESIKPINTEITVKNTNSLTLTDYVYLTAGGDETKDVTYTNTEDVTLKISTVLKSENGYPAGRYYAEITKDSVKYEPNADQTEFVPVKTHETEKIDYVAVSYMVDEQPRFEVQLVYTTTSQTGSEEAESEEFKQYCRFSNKGTFLSRLGDFASTYSSNINQPVTALVSNCENEGYEKKGVTTIKGNLFRGHADYQSIISQMAFAEVEMEDEFFQKFHSVFEFRRDYYDKTEARMERSEIDTVFNYENKPISYSTSLDGYSSVGSESSLQISYYQLDFGGIRN